MTTLTISEEEREQWRKDVDGVLYDDDFFGDEECIILNARRLAYTLNVLEAVEARVEKAEARAEKAERERDAALEQNAAKIQAATVEILNGFTNAVAGTDGKKHFSVGITCPYCGFRCSSIEEAEAHDGQCEKHPGVMRAVEAEQQRDALAMQCASLSEKLYPDDSQHEGWHKWYQWIEWVELHVRQKKKAEAAIETHLASANSVSVLGLKTVVSREPYPVESPLRDELGPVPGKPSNLKKWTVDFNMDLYAVFHGIEAKTADEAKEIAADMLLDDPLQYLDFSDPSQFEVYEDNEEDNKNET